jgi:4-hydroxy-tetrahydrodipicolinate reductase
MTNNLLKIAIIGYGAMGKEIEIIAKNKGIIISNIFDIDSKINCNQKYDFDVAIDFSTSIAVLDNLECLAKFGKNMVIGTTGWYEKIDDIKKIVNENNIGCIWSSNFSIGMQLFFRIIAETTKLSDQFKLYDTFISEIHHTNKIDSPSGTAKRLGNIIIENSNSKHTILNDNINRKISSKELHISSLRGGTINGIHTVYFDSIADTIELTHRAKSRTGFAEGAVVAAEWLNNKKGFYCFDNILFDEA